MEMGVPASDKQKGYPNKFDRQKEEKHVEVSQMRKNISR